MKLYQISFLFWVSLALSAPCLHAQTGAPVESVNVFEDNKYTPSPSKSKEVDEDERPAWALKFSPTLLTRGELPVFVERRLSARYGLEAAIGITFEDYFKETVFQGKPLLQQMPNENKLSGITAKFSLHYFTGKGKPGPLYLAPEIDFKNYRKDVHGVFLGSDGRYASGALRDQQIYTDFKAVLGYQTPEQFERDFFFDWFIGLGLRLGSENNVSYDEQNASVIRLKHVNVISPVLSVGVKLGFGL
jgi:hypothetical protein